MCGKPSQHKPGLRTTLSYSVVVPVVGGDAQLFVAEALADLLESVQLFRTQLLVVGIVAEQLLVEHLQLLLLLPLPLLPLALLLLLGRPLLLHEVEHLGRILKRPRTHLKDSAR